MSKFPNHLFLCRKEFEEDQHSESIDHGNEAKINWNELRINIGKYQQKNVEDVRVSETLCFVPVVKEVATGSGLFSSLTDDEQTFVASFFDGALELTLDQLEDLWKVLKKLMSGMRESHSEMPPDMKEWADRMFPEEKKKVVKTILVDSKDDVKEERGQEDLGRIKKESEGQKGQFMFNAVMGGQFQATNGGMIYNRSTATGVEWSTAIDQI